MTFMEKLKALVNGEGETSAEPAAISAPVAPAVDVAAQIEAGINAGLLTAKRAEAKAAAVRAYGASTPGYQAMVSAIDAVPTVEGVDAIVASLGVVATTTFAGTTGQQTISTGSTMETTYNAPCLQNPSLMGALLRSDKTDPVFSATYAALKQKGMVE